jgi:hypothetical protein
MKNTVTQAATTSETTTLLAQQLEQALLGNLLSRQQVATRLSTAMRTLSRTVPNFMSCASQMASIRLHANTPVQHEGATAGATLGAILDEVVPTTLPAVISTELRAAGVRNVRWTDLSMLPGAQVPEILALGLSIFRHFGLKKGAGIRVVANTEFGDLLNNQLDMNAVLHFLEQAAVKLSPDNMTIVMGDYCPEVRLYCTERYAYLAVFEDTALHGRYIYAFEREVQPDLLSQQTQHLSHRS